MKPEYGPNQGPLLVKEYKEPHVYLRIKIMVGKAQILLVIVGLHISKHIQHVCSV